MTFLYLKAVHIIFIVTWFAGLFYMPRLFVYIIESHTKPEPERTILLKQLNMMASRLWFAITWPSAIVTLIMGTSLLINQPSFLQQGYMHVKLTLVVLLYGYHFSLHYLFKQLQRGVVKYTSQQLRFWNEVSTLFLIAIVFIIVLKSALSMVWGLAGLLAVIIAITLGIRLYKKYRKNE
ncbi:putative membrane protein [Chryseolinea serpens]|uniref:Protoporphyrinogen IX oxidase n=1 Tax=Chryseolinea serpens TaxID=947013 RepID=A0A1M5NEU1_9BACT|nr:CopD family protein [Chryseolinea serpens]SHG88094.1 putative membrane protein [Chryseolinea serpens]